MKAIHQYIKIYGRYYCIKQNILILSWYLYRYNKLIQFRGSHYRRKWISIVKKFCIYYLRPRHVESKLEMPIFGNLCLPVHRGFKVFNFKKKNVTKNFSPNTDLTLVKREIEGVRKASLLNFSPKILRWNIKEKWYTEEFIVGKFYYSYKKNNTKFLLEIYQQEIEPCIIQMILLQAPVLTPLRKYVEEIITRIKNKVFYSSKTDRIKYEPIKKFINTVAARLNFEKSCKVYLIFSHGDFSLVNILHAREGIKVIDWESAGLRNPLFDLYNFFFTEQYYQNANINLVTEIGKTISSLRYHLKSKASDLTESIVSSAEIYRWLYYLERIDLLMERKFSNNLLSVILRSINVFSCYEKGYTEPKSFINGAN